MTKFKNGEMLMVRGDLRLGEVYGNLEFTSEMEAYRNRIVTIRSNTDTYIENASGGYLGIYYHINQDEGRFGWSEEMLQKVSLF